MPEVPIEELPESVREQMKEIINRARGSVIEELVWNKLTDAQQKWLVSNCLKEELEKFGAIELWQNVYGVTYGRAALDVNRKCELISEDHYQDLLAQTGLAGEDLPVSIQKAIASAKLVLINDLRLAYWQQELIDIAWQKKTALWEYFWKLARAAKHHGTISNDDFADEVLDKNLIDWKSRLLKTEGFPMDIGAFIETSEGHHCLDLPAENIRLFEKDKPKGFSEIQY